MNIHFLQHVDFESPVYIETWAKRRGYSFIGHHIYRGEPFPSLNDFDFLVVMGGPMGTNDEEKFPWMTIEKKLIRDSVHAGKRVLGICLGHQLLAAALGGKVGKNPEPETGFGPIAFAPEAAQSAVFQKMAGTTVHAFQLHGDAVTELPASCRTLATNAACPIQAFETKDSKAVGLQFHLELTPERLEDVARCMPNDFKKQGAFVHDLSRVRLDMIDFAPKAHVLLESILDNMVALHA